MLARAELQRGDLGRVPLVKDRQLRVAADRLSPQGDPTAAPRPGNTFSSTGCQAGPPSSSSGSSMRSQSQIVSVSLLIQQQVSGVHRRRSHPNESASKRSVKRVGTKANAQPAMAPRMIRRSLSLDMGNLLVGEDGGTCPSTSDRHATLGKRAKRRSGRSIAVPWDTLVEHAEPVFDQLEPDARGQMGLARSGRPEEEHVRPFIEPDVAARQDVRARLRHA